MIEKAVRWLLLAEPEITAVVGDEGVYPHRVPQNVTIPAIVYERTSTERSYTHAGASGVATATMVIRCLASTYDAALELAEDVRYAISGYRGIVRVGGFDTQVNNITVVNEFDSEELPADGSDEGYFIREFTIEAAYCEPVKRY